MIDQFRRPMRIFPRNTTAEEMQRDRDAFDRVAADMATPSADELASTWPSPAFPEQSSGPSAITPPARVSWWKRLFGIVG